MVLLIALLLSAPIALASPPQAPAKEAEVWKATWNDLARLAASPPGSRERERLWRALDTFQADREQAGHKASDRAEALRARVLRFHLSRLNGARPVPLKDPGASIEFLPGEAWLALQALGPGPTRVRATRAAVAEARGEELRTRAERAREVVEEDALELHLDWALDEARALRESVTQPWTAALLARTLRLRGEYEPAVRVLDAAIESAPERAARATLFDELARIHAAAGDDAAALSDLGSALAGGSTEAGLALGLRALAEGEPARGRATLRSLTGPAAARGYALSLLATDTELPRNPPDRPH